LEDENLIDIKNTPCLTLQNNRTKEELEEYIIVGPYRECIGSDKGKKKIIK